MGVTAIRKVRNNSSSIAMIRNNETPSDTTGGKGDVEANSEKDLYMWIPWCTDSGGFANHHIQINMDDGRSFSLWQANLGGSDQVRVSTDDSWHNPGDSIPGISEVDGDRTLIIDDQGISLEEDTSPMPNPSHQAQSGKATVCFGRPTPRPPMVGDPVGIEAPSGDVFDYTGTSDPTPRGARINRFTNTAKDINGAIAIPLRISFVDSDGLPAGPNRVDPHQTFTGDFTGLLTEGSWSARAVDISNVFLPNVFSIDLFWTGNIGSGSNPLTGTPQVVISAIRQNPPGSDVQPETGEYVELTNNDTETADVAGWYLEDERGTRITIPAGCLIPAGSSLRIYTGPGTNTDDRYYCGRRKAVWNNPGDSIRLFTPTGGIVHALIY